MAAEHAAAEAIESGLKIWGELRDTWCETLFHAVYGNPVLQAAVGMAGSAPPRRAGQDLVRTEAVAHKRASLVARLDQGTVLDAFVRGLIWIVQASGHGDERAFATLVRFRETDALAPLRGDAPKVTLEQFKAAVHDQSMILRMDEAAAVAALPKLLPAEPTRRRMLVDAVRQVVTASGPLDGEAALRLARLEAMAQPVAAE